MSPAAERLRRNIASLFTLQAAAYVIPLIMAPYLVRVLGPGQYGRTAFAMAIVQYFVVLADYGFNLTATRQAAILRDNPEALSRLFNAVTVVKLGLTAAGFLALCGLLAVVPAMERDTGLYFACYLAVLGHVAFPVWLFQGLERMKIVTQCTIAAQVVVLVCVFSWVREPGDYRLAAGLQSAASLVAGLLSWAALRGVIQRATAWPQRAYLREVVAQGWHVFVSTLAMSLYTATGTVILGFLATPAVVGYFAAADRLVKAVLGLLSPVSQAVFPHVARIRHRSRNEALLFLSGLLRWQGLATLVVSTLLWAFAEPLVELLFGAAFSASTPLLRYMAFIPFVVGLSNVLGMQTMLNFDMNRQFSRVLLGSGLANILLLLVLFDWFGVSGAAVSLFLTEAGVTIVMAVILFRKGLLPVLLGKGLNRGA
ncbi:MAG TPA: flippase [Ramlibacter sp.]|nr:flippase [Ramlibacter sp.]